MAGVDMTLTSVLEGVLQAQPEPGTYAFLLDREGRVISAPGEARADLGLPPYQSQQPGRAVVTPLATSAVAEVKELADRIHGASAPGLTGFTAAGGRRYAAYSNKEISARLGIAESTVKTHLASLFAKLEVNDRTQAVTAAIRRGWLRLR